MSIQLSSKLTAATALLLVFTPFLRADDAPAWKDVTPGGLSSDANTHVNTVDYGNGVFVALGGHYVAGDATSIHSVSYTSKDGATWTEHVLDFPGSGLVRFSHGKFSLFGAAPTQTILSSPDGVTWSSAPDPDSEGYLVGLAEGNGVIVAARGAGLDGPRVDVSADAANWQGVALPPAGSFDANTSIAFGAGQFALVSAGTSLPHLFTSPDGRSWTAQTGLGNGNGYIYIAYGNGTFLAQENGISQQISADGITWTAASPGVTQNLPGIGTLPLATRYGRFLNGQFIAVGGGSAGFNLYASADAKNWTPFGTVAASSDYVRDVAFGGGHYVAVTNQNIFVSNAGGSAPPPVVKAADLTVDFSGVKIGSNAAGSKSKFKGALTVSNSGKKPAKNVQVAAYLSDDRSFSAAEDKFVSLLRLSDFGFPTLAKNGGATGPVAVKFVAKTSDLGATTGKYLLVVADPQNAINDGDRANNVFAYGPLP